MIVPLLHSNISFISLLCGEHKMISNSPMATLPLRNPSPTAISKRLKSPKRASKLISRMLGLGRLKSVRKSNNETVVTYYLNGITTESRNYHVWAWDYKEAAKVRKQDSKVITVSKCTALVNLIDTPMICLALEADFAR